MKPMGSIYLGLCLAATLSSTWFASRIALGDRHTRTLHAAISEMRRLHAPQRRSMIEVCRAKDQIEREFISAAAYAMPGVSLSEVAGCEGPGKVPRLFLLDNPDIPALPGSVLFRGEAVLALDAVP